MPADCSVLRTSTILSNIIFTIWLLIKKNLYVFAKNAQEFIYFSQTPQKCLAIIHQI